MVAKSLKVSPVQGDFLESAALETAAEVAVAVTMILTDELNGTEWTFSEAAEDNGTAGALDGQDGIIYNGPSGASARLHITDLDISEGTIAPEATDEVAVAVYVNSTLYDICETEDARVLAGTGFVSEIDTGIAVEFNYDATIQNLQEGDVVRVALLSGNEETTDWDVAAGGNLTLS